MIKLKINDDVFTAFYDGDGKTQLKETVDIFMQLSEHFSNLVNTSFENTLCQLCLLTLERKENDNSFSFEVNEGYERGNDLLTK